MKKVTSHFLLLLALYISTVDNLLAVEQPVWYGKDANEQPVIHL
mgnify:CR=1 FL=1